MNANSQQPNNQPSFLTNSSMQDNAKDSFLVNENQSLNTNDNLFVNDPELNVVSDASMQEPSLEDQLVSGSSWLTLGNLVSRILGALYVIPWTMLLGTNYLVANNLFAKGYTIYAVFLMLATAGIPTAIANLVAKNNGLNQYRASLALLRTSLRLSALLGVAGALLLFIGSWFLAAGDKNLVPVLQSLAPAVLVFPFISMLRGFFQGQQLMDVSAISQIIEQVVRIVYMLGSAIVILSQKPTDWQSVVVQSTFAAFIGALASAVYLLIAYSKRRELFIRQAAQSRPLATNGQNKGFVVPIIKQALPFIIVGAAITIYQLVDQYSFYIVMEHFFNFTREQLDLQLGRFNANANKLIMIIVPLATAISSTALPMLSKSVAQQNKESSAQQIRNIYRLFTLVMLPTAFGMYGIAQPLYAMFYGTSDPNQMQGVYLLQESAVLSIFFGAFMVLAMIGQGIGETRYTLKAFGAGLVIKVIFQALLVGTLQASGALLATVIGFSFSIWLLHDLLKQKYQVSYLDETTSIVKVLAISLLSSVLAYAISFGLGELISNDRLGNSIIVILAATISGAVGFYLMQRVNAVDSWILNRLPNWLKFNTKSL